MAAVAALAMMAGPAAAAELAAPLTYSADPAFTIETGSDFTLSSVTALSWGERSLLHRLEERPATGIPTRAVRTLIFDLPVSLWFAILQHEAFGHGGRAREFGSETGVHMGSPWSFERDSYASFEADQLTNTELIWVYAGGVEANQWTASMMQREMVGGRPVTSLELLFQVWNRYATPAYVLRTTPDPEDDPAGFWAEWAGGGDVANYIGHMNIRFYGEPGITPEGSSPTVIRMYRDMERQAVWNLLDPGLWMALWSVGKRIGLGDQPAVAPSPRLGGRRFMPALSAYWLEDAPVIGLETIFGRSSPEGNGTAWFSFVARYGPGPAGIHRALGAGIEKLWEAGRLRVGGESEIWSRLGGGIGGGGLLRFRFRGGAMEGFWLDVGAKSAGHWPGRPAAVGPFLRLGFTYRS
jgi:hypothetical protein